LDRHITGDDGAHAAEVGNAAAAALMDRWGWNWSGGGGGADCSCWLHGRLAFELDFERELKFFQYKILPKPADQEREKHNQHDCQDPDSGRQALQVLQQRLKHGAPSVDHTGIETLYDIFGGWEEPEPRRKKRAKSLNREGMKSAKDCEGKKSKKTSAPLSDPR
jgi:hypothetical protein